jgi:hypothetical protein
MAALTLNPSGTSAIRTVLASASTALTMLPGFDGQECQLIFQQDGTGGRAITATNIYGLQEPAQAANATSIQTVVYNALNNFWTVIPGLSCPNPTYGTSAATPVAIPATSGLYELTGSVVTYTLAAPTAGGPGTGNDFQLLYIANTVKHANVITITGLLNGTTATFAGSTGEDSLQLMAYNAKWYVVGGTGVTMS